MNEVDAPDRRPVDLAPSIESPRSGPRERGRGLLTGGWSRGLGLLVAAGVLLAICGLSLAVGAKSIPLGTVWDALFGSDGSPDHIVIRSLRFPRTVLGLAVGIALGLAGTIMQGVTRNPLADPGILGVSAGASLGVVIAIYVFGVGALTGYVWFAFAGAALASVVVYTLGSSGRGGATPVKMALAGAAVTALLLSFTQAILISDLATLDQYRFWAVGSLAGRDGTVVAMALPFIAAGTLVALGLGPALNALALGDFVL